MFGCTYLNMFFFFYVYGKDFDLEAYKSNSKYSVPVAQTDVLPMGLISRECVKCVP